VRLLLCSPLKKKFLPPTGGVFFSFKKKTPPLIEDLGGGPPQKFFSRRGKLLGDLFRGGLYPPGIFGGEFAFNRLRPLGGSSLSRVALFLPAGFLEGPILVGWV